MTLQVAAAAGPVGRVMDADAGALVAAVGESGQSVGGCLYRADRYLAFNVESLG